jgi:hypothetical protein
MKNRNFWLWLMTLSLLDGLFGFALSQGLVSQALAQGPIGRPAPYNISSESVVLQLADMPGGYKLDEDSSGPTKFSEEEQAFNPANGYETFFLNLALFQRGTPFVGSKAIVFYDAESAQGFMDHIRQWVDDAPSSSSVAVTNLGDETIAYQFVVEEVTVYLIAIRKENVISVIFTGALSTSADFKLALSFAKKTAKKF